MLPSSLPLPGDKALRLYVARVAGHASPIGVVARSGLGELSRALGPDVDVVDVEAVDVSRVVLPPGPPAPEPEMPARVFVLVTGSRVVGLASRLADLGHLIHEVDRAQFLRSGEKDADRYWWLAEKDENGFVITKLSVVEPIRSGLVGPAVATTVSASSPPTPDLGRDGAAHAATA